MWNTSDHPPPGTQMNGASGSHGHLDTILLMLGELRGCHHITLETVQQGFREQHRINRVVAADVASLKEGVMRSSDKAQPWWKDLPIKELALLAIIALSGLLQVLQPVEVKSAVRSVLMKATGSEK